MIDITFNAENEEIFIETSLIKELNINEAELKLVKIILSFLPPDISSCITLQRKSKSYISMLYGINDFLRFKYSEKAKWISLRLPRNLAKSNLENPLFAAQIRKSQSHWQAALHSLDDLESFRNFIIASCIYIPNPSNSGFPQI